MLCFGSTAYAETKEMSDAKRKLQFFVEYYQDVLDDPRDTAQRHSSGLPYTMYGENWSWSDYNDLEATTELWNYPRATEENYEIECEMWHDTIYNKFYVMPEVAQLTCENAKKEQNYNNWYDEDEWNEFQDSITALDEIVYTSPDPQELALRYRNMLSIYNKMTNEYTVTGDLNKDGVVSISDVSLLQKYLSEMVELTGAQKMLTNANIYESPTIRDVSNLQKYIAGLNDSFEDNNIFIYQKSITDTTVPTEIIYQYAPNFNIVPRTYDVWYTPLEKEPYTFDNDTLAEYMKMNIEYFDWCEKYNLEP